MKVFSVTGLTGSGKTTTIEKIIVGLKNRGFSVGSVKEIHYEAFKMDTDGKNTSRHRVAGSELVTARAVYETDIMIPYHEDIYKILKHYDQDYVVLEGVRDCIVPEIACAKEDEEPMLTDLTIAISGRKGNLKDTYYQGLPIINALDNTEQIVDLIVEKVPHLMFNIDKECCDFCGSDCREFLSKYLKNEVQLSDCKIKNSDISLKVGDKDIPMVPFVQKLLINTIKGFVSELKGCEESSPVEIKIK